MKWIVRFLALVGLWYGGLIFISTLGIGHSIFYYGPDPVQRLIDKDGTQILIIGKKEYNADDIINPEETK